MSPKCCRSARLLKSISLILLIDLPHQLPGLHVVVGIFEDASYDSLAMSLAVPMP